MVKNKLKKLMFSFKIKASYQLDNITNQNYFLYNALEFALLPYSFSLILKMAIPFISYKVIINVTL